MNGLHYAKIGKGLLIAMGGAAITYLFGVLDVIDVEATTPILVALMASLLNVARVYLRSINDKKNGNNKTENPPA